MYNKTHETELTQRRKNMHWILVIFGTICGAISFVMSVIEIIKAFSEDDPAGEEIANPLQNDDTTHINLGQDPAVGGLRFWYERYDPENFNP